MELFVISPGYWNCHPSSVLSQTAGGRSKTGSINCEICTGRERAQDGAFDRYFGEINPQSVLLLNYSSMGKFGIFVTLYLSRNSMYSSIHRYLAHSVYLLTESQNFVPSINNYGYTEH